VKDWFMSLQPRERLILGGGACLAVVIVFFAAVWSPLRTGSANLRESITDKERLLTELVRSEALGEETSSAPADASTSLVVIVDSTAQEGGLDGTLRNARPDGANGINVSFQNAPFDQLEEWLFTLETEHGVAVENASINDARQQGLVSGQLFLRRN
jgi:general secretion pathway protein M